MRHCILSSSAAGILALSALVSCSEDPAVESLNLVEECLQTPDSIKASFDFTTKVTGVATYLFGDDSPSISEEEFSGYDEIYERLDFEDWSHLTEDKITACQDILGNIAEKHPKSKAVGRTAGMIRFVANTIGVYGIEQLERNQYAVSNALQQTDTCYKETYPQLFDNPNFTQADPNNLYPALFSVTWDDETVTLDGRDFLLRPIVTTQEVMCAKELEKVAHLFDAVEQNAIAYVEEQYELYGDAPDVRVEAELSVIRPRWQRELFKALPDAVSNYNDFVRSQHQELIDAGEKIPAKKH